LLNIFLNSLCNAFASHNILYMITTEVNFNQFNHARIVVHAPRSGFHVDRFI